MPEVLTAGVRIDELTTGGSDMQNVIDAELDEIQAIAGPLAGPDDLRPLIDRVGDARFVCIGEASHGTHDYYGWRCELSRQLIEQKGFDLIGVEGDWPDCWRLNQWVRGRAEPGSDAREILEGFERWPTWRRSVGPPHWCFHRIGRDVGSDLLRGIGRSASCTNPGERRATMSPRSWGSVTTPSCGSSKPWR